MAAAGAATSLQAQLYTQLLGSGFLSDSERDVLRWGRNATGEPLGALLACLQFKVLLASSAWCTAAS
jgi:hypothetical protein